MTELELAGLTSAERDDFEERAAIREYDGGFPRHTAEKLAYLEIVRGRSRRLGGSGTGGGSAGAT